MKKLFQRRSNGLFLVLGIGFLLCAIAAGTRAASPYRGFAEGPIFFNWDPVGARRVTALTRDVPATPARSIVLEARAAPGEYEPISFVIRANETSLSEVTFSVSDLKSSSGRTISRRNIKLQWVKCWYQAAKPGQVGNRGVNAVRRLKPELLLYDTDLVRVDYAKETNSLRVMQNGKIRYLDMTEKGNPAFPLDASFQDAKTLQPVNLMPGRNQQVWPGI